MQQKINFTKGMRKDLSPIRQDPSTYFKAVNKSLLSNNLDTNGAISDELGNKFIHDILAESGSTAGSVIIKLDSIRDWIVCFIRGINGVDKIVRFKINDADSIEDFTTVYSSYLNFGTTIETVYRYRDENFCKVYWADGVNQLRSINIFDPNSPSINIKMLDSVSEYITTQPTIKRILTGGMYKSGKVQYAYQLYNIDGGETIISPTSYAVPVSESSLSGDTKTFQGSPVDKDTGKSIDVEISLAATSVDRFEYIKIIAIHYTDGSAAPFINIVEERRIGSNTINFRDAGTTVLGTYSPEEFNFIGSRLIKPKSITTKDNHLIAANIKEEYFDIDDYLEQYWDARAYRFKPTSGTGSDWAPCSSSGGGGAINRSFQLNGTEDVPEDWDAIQTKTEQKDWKYDLDDNLGGHGPNIRYEFVPRVFTLDNFSVGADKISVSVEEQNFNALGIGYTSSSGVFPNYTSPTTSQIVGYMRDEMYRFGIVFIDNFGRHSFVKWIADVKMPNKDDDAILGDPYFFEGGELKGRALGVKFIIDFSGFPSGFKYYIVRAKRTDLDKTILSQGIMGTVMKNEVIDTDRQYFSRMATAGDDKDAGASSLRVYTQYKDSSWAAGNLITFTSPEVVYGTYNGNHVSTDRIYPLKQLEYDYKVEENSSYKFKKIYHRCGVTIGNETEKNSHLIRGGVVIDSGGIAYLENYNGPSPFRNDLYYLKLTGDVKTLRIGIGGTTQLLSLDSTIGDIPPMNDSWQTHLVMNYVRNNETSIYGGLTYNSKLLSPYIKASNLRNCSETPAIINVFGGDTYIAMFDAAHAFSHHNPSSDLNGQIRAWTTIFPVETTINLDYVHGFNSTKNRAYRNAHLMQETTTLGKEFFGEAYPNFYGDYYQYNKAYSRDADLKIYTGKPFIFRPLVELDARIIDSEKNLINDYLDNWTRFLYTSVQDLDSQFGPINAIKIFNSKLYAFQDKAFSTIGYNDRELVQSDASTSLTLGSSDRLTFHQYISETSGCIHNKSIVNAGNSLYYFDGINKRMMLYNNEGVQSLSDIMGMATYFKDLDYKGANLENNLLTFTEAKGIISQYDFNSRKLYTIIHTGTDESYNISFNELLQSYESEHSWGTIHLINHSNRLLSEKGGKLYSQNKGAPLNFFGEDSLSSVTFIVTGIPDVKKVFTNLEFGAYLKDSNNNSYSNPIGNFIPVTSIRVSNSYQSVEDVNTYFEYLNIYYAYVAYVESEGGTIGDPELLKAFYASIIPGESPLRRRFKTWRYQVPRDSDKLRLMDYFFYVTIENSNLTVDGGINTVFNIDDITAHYLIPLI